MKNKKVAQQNKKVAQNIRRRLDADMYELLLEVSSVVTVIDVVNKQGVRLMADILVTECASYNGWLPALELNDAALNQYIYFEATTLGTLAFALTVQQLQRQHKMLA